MQRENLLEVVKLRQAFHLQPSMHWRRGGIRGNGGTECRTFYDFQLKSACFCVLSSYVTKIVVIQSAPKNAGAETWKSGFYYFKKIIWVWSRFLPELKSFHHFPGCYNILRKYFHKVSNALGILKFAQFLFDSSQKDWKSTSASSENPLWKLAKYLGLLKRLNRQSESFSIEKNCQRENLSLNPQMLREFSFSPILNYERCLLREKMLLHTSESELLAEITDRLIIFAVCLSFWSIDSRSAALFSSSLIATQTKPPNMICWLNKQTIWDVLLRESNMWFNQVFA